MKVKTGFVILFLMIFVLASQVNASEDEEDFKYEFENEIYIAPYVGDIDGSVSENRFLFYKKLAQFHAENDIPVGMSFYPGTLIEDPDFMEPFFLMYFDKDIELIQKGYLGDEKEAVMATLPYEEQKQIIKNGQDVFEKFMKKNLGVDEVYLPMSYNQIQGSFTDETEKAAMENGLKQYFDVFVSGGYEQAQTTDDFISIQYGVSYLKDSTILGWESEFRTKEEILTRLDNYERFDINITYIDGKPVVPLWVHQQDFSDPNSPDYIDKEKWELYQEILLLLKNDPKVTLIHPADVHETLLGKTNPPKKFIEQYPMYIDKFTKINRTIVHQKPSYVCKNFKLPLVESTMSFSSGCEWISENIPFVELKTEKTFVKEGGKTIVMTYPFEHVLEDAIFEMKLGNEDLEIIKITAYDSLNNKEQEIEYTIQNGYLIGKIPNGIVVNKVKMELEEDSEIPAFKPVLKGKFSDIEDSGNVEVCTWKDCKRGAVSVSVDDFFTTCMPELEEQGYRGTYYLANTYNQTIYDGLWEKFNDAFKKGHEIGTHTRSHWCIFIGEEQYRKDIENNIADIVNNTDIKREDIVSHSQPCGYTNYQIQKIIEENGYLTARGYNYNKFEIPAPNNPFDLKSFNDEGYPGGELDPGDYFEIVNTAQKEKRWANLVFHSYCNDKDIIEHLPTKNVWVDTVGNVMRYNYLRDNVEIRNYEFDKENQTVSFNTWIPDQFNEKQYSHNLTLDMKTHDYDVEDVFVNDKKVEYEWFRDSEGYHIIFDIPFPIKNNKIKVKLK